MSSDRLKRERESRCTHAETSHVPFRSTEAQEVQIKGQFGISIWILCKKNTTQTHTLTLSFNSLFLRSIQWQIQTLYWRDPLSLPGHMLHPCCHTASLTLKNFYQQTSTWYFVNTAVINMGLHKPMRNNSDRTVETGVFAEQSQMIQHCLKLWCILMLTQMLSGMWWLKRSQFASMYWMDVLSVVSVGTA